VDGQLVLRRKVGEVVKRVIILRGLPGAGKTDLLETLNYDVVCSADDYFKDIPWDGNKLETAHNECWLKFIAALSTAKTVVVDNTNTRKWEFEKYAKLAMAKGFRVTTLIVENRQGSESIHNVPKITLRKMQERFEVCL